MERRRRVAVVTGSRADYGLYYYILQELHGRPDAHLQLVVTGMHLAPQFGLTVREVERDGFPIAARVEMLLAGDTGGSAGRSVGLAVIGLTQALEALGPDLLLLLGDRSEMLAASTAALHLGIPCAHIHGGESTEGAIDEAIRHAVTKLSHVHFAAAEVYAERIRRMGEEPWRVHVTGAPGLDHLYRTPRLGVPELSARLGVDFSRRVVLATFHPVTLELAHTGAYIRAFLDALEGCKIDVVFTYPNADPGGQQVLAAIQQRAAENPRLHLVPNMGSQLYFSAMAASAAMAGNSSSGIIEAPSLGLPVVNVGSRQAGRVRASNVIDVGYGTAEIRAGLERALHDQQFREQAARCANPYGDGHASERIVRVLMQLDLGPRLLHKRLAY